MGCWFMSMLHKHSWSDLSILLSVCQHNNSYHISIEYHLKEISPCDGQWSLCHNVRSVVEVAL